MNVAERQFVADELDLVRTLLPLEGARVLDLGCGDAQMSRRMLREAGAASVVALEADRIQHGKNLAAPAMPGLTAVLGGAQAVPCDDASFDGVTMFKSLHHVPLDAMDRALAEIRRVLVPGGLLYVSEPVFAGDLNEIIRLFHDEELVRRKAVEALDRAEALGVLLGVAVRHFDMPVVFRDFAEFEAKLIHVTHSEHSLDAATMAEVKRRFAAHVGPNGAKFVRPMRVNLLRRAPEGAAPPLMFR